MLFIDAPALRESKDDLGACAHCGLPVGAGSAPRGRFCCSACETVYALLKEHDLAGYYELRAQTVETKERPKGADAATFAEMDSEGFSELYCRGDGSGLTEAELKLEGLHCAACVWLIEKLPRIEPSIREARVDFSRGTVHLRYDAKEKPLSGIARTIAKLGYFPSAPRGQNAAVERQRELRGLLVRMGVAGACAGNAMLLAFSLYSADAAGSLAMDAVTRSFFEWASLVVTLPALFAGSVFFRSAYAALRLRTIHMDVPIAVGILAAVVSGTVGLLRGTGELYFDTVTTLIFLLLVGRYLTARQKLRGALTAELLHSLVPARCQKKLPDGKSEEVDTDSLLLGDRIYVLSGDVCPVDGVVVEGNSTLNLSLLSGESLPVPVSQGAEVLAGAQNQGSRLEVECRRTGHSTRVGRLAAEVGRALSERTPLVSEAARIAAAFTWAVLVLALATFAIFLPVGPGEALKHSLSLLIVTCPCALAMATPLALSAATGSAARQKILIFGAPVIERLAHPLDIVLDKTGTLTQGSLTVSMLMGESSELNAAAALEKISLHPVAVSLLGLANEEAVRQNAERLTQVEEVVGQGVRGSAHGEEWVVGSARFVLRQACLDMEQEGLLARLPPRTSPVLFARGGRVRAIFGVSDDVRPGISAVLRGLKADGHRLFLLSGDEERVVASVARAIEEETAGGPLFDGVFGGIDPEGKLAWISERVQAAVSSGARQVAMVGDGVNDAAALSRAHIGVAVRGAAEASRLSADVFLAGGGALDLGQLICGSRRVLSTIRRGLIFSLLYNLLGVALAFSGHLSPLWAAILMPLSSLTVVTNAFRSRSFEPAPRGRERRSVAVSRLSFGGERS